MYFISPLSSICAHLLFGVDRLPFFSIPLVGWLADEADDLIAVAVAVTSTISSLFPRGPSLDPPKSSHRIRPQPVSDPTPLSGLFFPTFLSVHSLPKKEIMHMKKTTFLSRPSHPEIMLRGAGRSHIRKPFVRFHSLSSFVSLFVVHTAICYCFGKMKRRKIYCFHQEKKEKRRERLSG